MSAVAGIIALVFALGAGSTATQRDANMPAAAFQLVLALAFGAGALILHR